MPRVTESGATSRRGRGRVPGWIRVEPLITAAAVLAVWVIGAQFTPDYVIPPLPIVALNIWEIFTTGGLLRNAVVTLLRVVAGLVGAFLVGTALGLVMGWSRTIERYVMPLLRVTQGIPSLSWVVIAIIWFQQVELRIWFILVVVTLPGFAFQTLDSYRAIPAELKAMAQSLRPRRFDLFRTVTWPAIVPDLLTAWKINLGLGTRVVLVAELVGAAIGVGYQLLSRQQLFDMAGVVAWTAVLVIFVLLVQFLIERVERHLLRYRPQRDRQVDEPEVVHDRDGEVLTA